MHANTTLSGMTFLLPQERIAMLQSMRAVEIHGDRYLDLALLYDGEPAPRVARVSRSECPEGLTAGNRVSVRLVMGVVTRVSRVE